MSRLPPESFGCFACQIDNLFSLSKDEGFSLDSPSFVAAGTTWCLRLFPNKKKDWANVVELHLVRLEPPFQPYSLVCLAGFKNSSDEIFEYSFDEITFKEDEETARLTFYFYDSFKKLLYKDQVLNGRLNLYFLMFKLTRDKKKESVLSSERENFLPVEGK